jgi:alkylresorcinol/alkylpyrone synthase
MPTEIDVLASPRTEPRGAPVLVDVTAVATAVPTHVIDQAEATERARKVFPQYARLEALYANTGIATRYSVEPMPWHLTTHTWEERTETYQRNALVLLERVATKAVADAGLDFADIDAIAINTITGLAIPSLDARLMNLLPFRPQTTRLPIFGLGCGGGVGGLALAARFAQARPGSNVLFLTVDLCTLCMRVNDPSLAMFVAASLFGDGAAAVVLRSRRDDGLSTLRALSPARVGAMGEYFWRDTEHIMGWDIKDDGFGVVLSPELPTLMRERLGEALLPFLVEAGLSLHDFDGFLLHPGGSKILDTAEHALGLSHSQLDYSWHVLKTYGNMSSATALFVLKEALSNGARGRYLLAAFGPGFAAYFIVMEL